MQQYPEVTRPQMVVGRNLGMRMAVSTSIGCGPASSALCVVTCILGRQGIFTAIAGKDVFALTNTEHQKDVSKELTDDV